MKKQLGKETAYLRVSLFWESNVCDVDLSAFLLDSSGKARSDRNLIFYNNAFAANKALIYGGDNRGTELDMDETILVQLGLIPEEIKKVVFCVTVSDEGETFGSAQKVQLVANVVSGPYDKGTEPLCRVNVSEIQANGTGMIVFELTRSGSGWKYEQVAHPVKGGLAELCQKFGLEVE